MTSSAVRNDPKYTYEDYCKFNDDKRREIIDGVIYLMTAPSDEHQEILLNLGRKFGNYLEGKKCAVRVAPYDVRLPKEGETKETSSTVVQPDIVVICDRNKINKRGCFGAPDLVIEILSPSTGSIDKVKKLNLYQEHGVREYWIVDPYSQTIDRLLFDKDSGKYKHVEYFGRDDFISPTIFSDLTINLEEVFPEIAEDKWDDENGQ